MGLVMDPAPTSPSAATTFGRAKVDLDSLFYTGLHHSDEDWVRAVTTVLRKHGLTALCWHADRDMYTVTVQSDHLLLKGLRHRATVSLRAEDLMLRSHTNAALMRVLLEQLDKGCRAYWDEVRNVLLGRFPGHDQPQPGTGRPPATVAR